MAIIRWTPWNLSTFLDEDLELPTAISRFMPQQGLNLYETPEAVMAEMALPGIPEEKIDVSVVGNTVRVSGSDTQKEEEKGKRRYFMSSMAYTYNYSFRLPEGVVEDKEPKAEIHDGILTLTFPKMEKVPPKRIKVSRK